MIMRKTWRNGKGRNNVHCRTPKRRHEKDCMIYKACEEGKVPLGSTNLGCSTPYPPIVKSIWNSNLINEIDVSCYGEHLFHGISGASLFIANNNVPPAVAVELLTIYPETNDKQALSEMKLSINNTVIIISTQSWAIWNVKFYSLTANVREKVISFNIRFYGERENEITFSWLWWLNFYEPP